MSQTKYMIQWLHLVAMDRTKYMIQWLYFGACTATNQCTVKQPYLTLQKYCLLC